MILWEKRSESPCLLRSTMPHSAHLSDIESMETLFASEDPSVASGLILVGITVVLVAVCTFALLRYYREKSVSWKYSSVIYISWYV